MFHKLRTYLRTWQPDIWNHNYEIRTNGSLTLKIQGSYIRFLLYQIQNQVQNLKN